MIKWTIRVSTPTHQSVADLLWRRCQAGVWIAKDVLKSPLIRTISAPYHQSTESNSNLTEGIPRIARDDEKSILPNAQIVQRSRRKTGNVSCRQVESQSVQANAYVAFEKDTLTIMYWNRSAHSTWHWRKSDRKSTVRRPSRRHPELLEDRRLLAADVIVSEIMYHPLSHQVQDEWIELHNRGDVIAELEGYRISDGVEFEFPASSIAAGGYLVVAADLDAFSVNYPEVSNVVGGWVGRLSNSGERVSIIDSAGHSIDDVFYADSGEFARRNQELVGSDRGRDGPIIPQLGWLWLARHDGEGSSLELVNTAFGNDFAHNWAASEEDGGTPGSGNSVHSADIAPVMVDVQHTPVIPTSADSVTVSVQLIDDHDNELSAVLFHRVSTLEPGSFLETPMQPDDSLGDRVYSATLPAMPHETIVEFYVVATDKAGNIRSLPAVTSVGTHDSNMLYQVDDIERPRDIPFYRTIMTPGEWERLRGGNRFNNAQMNATFIASLGNDTQVRYNAGLRYRTSTRQRNPPSYRVNLPSDRPWDGQTAMNINSDSPENQIAGSALFAMAGLAAADAFPVRMLHNGTDLTNGGFFAHVEPLHSDWASRHFPNDSEGNVYRGRRSSEALPGGRHASLEYFGEDPMLYGGYVKGSNQSEADWTDVIRMTDALNNTPEETYLEEVSKLVNIDQWLRVISVMRLTGYHEYGLLTGDYSGDDYAMYRPVEDPRFLMVPYDLDTMFLGAAAGGGLFPFFPVPTLKRLVDRPSVLRRFYMQLADLVDNYITEENIRPVLENLLGNVIEQTDIDSTMEFLVKRGNFVRSLIASQLTVVSKLPTTDSGIARTSDTTSGPLSGKTNALQTSTVLVAGHPAEYFLVGGKTRNIGNWSSDGVPLRPGLNRLLVQAMDDVGNEIDRTFIDIWREGTAVNNVNGTIDTDTTWTATDSPYLVSGNLIVTAAAALTIEPGTTVFFADNARMTVQGQLIAEGSEQETIRFSRKPESTGSWGGLQFDNSMAENRIHHAVIEYGVTNEGMIGLKGSRLEIDNVIFDHTDRHRIRTMDSSLVVRNSTFKDIFAPDQPPAADDQSEHIWGSGIPIDGWLILENNTFGHITGNNDSIDFDTSRKPGPIPQILNNLFVGGGDDAINLTGDAYIEGNYFRNFIKDQFNQDFGESNAISASSGDVTVVRNIFENVQHAALVKENAFVEFVNNTVVSERAALYFDLLGQTTGPGRGAHVSGSIFAGTDMPIQLEPAPLDGVTVEYSLLPHDGSKLGSGNAVGKPLFTNDERAPFQLRSGSQGVGGGPNGQDMGAAVPVGPSISGEPAAHTTQTSALLTVGGPGITHYRYRLNDAEFSAEFEIADPIELANLVDGSYQVQVIGKKVVGTWQDETTATRSLQWTVDSGLKGVVFNELLARNATAVPRGDTFPDLVELYNVGTTPVDLSGMGITDDPDRTQRFVFPENTILKGGEYLVLATDDPSPTPGFHLGFGLSVNGDGLYLFDGSKLIDSVEFGAQVTDISLSRDRNGDWTLGTPSFGQENLPISVGDPSRVRINEWSADGEVVFGDDFVELHNPDPSPVSLGNTFLTDNPVTWREQHQLPPLSFMGGNAVLLFIADSNPQDGTNHLSFRLSRIREMLGFSDPAGNIIHHVYFGPQEADVSRALFPNGGQQVHTVAMPTPGLLNPGPNAENPIDFDSNDVDLFEHLRISEVMYNPIGGGAFEFVELENTGTDAINLAGVSIEEGIEFTFPDAELGPGEFVVVAGDTQRFRDRYGDTVTVAGEYRGNLNNAGDRVRLRMPAPHRTNILDFVYEDRWYEITDGDGFSLEIVDPGSPDLAAWGQRGGWQASRQTGGSPGSLSQSLTGDFNGDMQLDVSDVDQLLAEVNSGSHTNRFDLTSDGQVDQADLDELVLNQLKSRYGDTDLDGYVDGTDFNTLAGNFGSLVTSWSNGDFDGDGKVGFSDFVILANNFGVN